MDSAEWDRTAKDYYNEVLSPIKDAKENPLFDDLEKIQSTKKVIDLGCGLGELEPILSKKFDEVTAIDFSKEMIKQAESKNKKLSNVKFKQKDMTNLNEFKNEFDVAIAINSIISDNINEINKILRQIHKTLKKNGTFIAVLPSMEVYAYLAMLLAEKENLKKAQKVINNEEHNFALGMTNFDDPQKTFYRFEIIHRLKKAGFKNIEIKKVLYPWSEFRNANQPSFPGEDLPWDWYAICKA